MRDLRIVFMGTPHFAVTILDEILNAGYNIVGVITAPDKPAGRGRKLQESAVKQFALEKGLKIMQPPNLKATEFIEELSQLQPNVQVVVAFRMLPKIVWQFPEYGTFNLHASLLPQYRGAAPINWAIINGETTTGVSTFFLDEKIDTGEMILQKEIPIDATENAGQLHDRLMEAGAHLVIKTLEKIKLNTVTTTKQPDSGDLKEAPKLTRDNTKIDWNAPVQDIYNFIRGLDPYPSAWCYLKNAEEAVSVKIYSVEMQMEKHSLGNGVIIIDGKELKVAARNGYIKILEMQLPGKRKMKIKDLLNGYQFEKNANLT